MHITTMQLANVFLVKPPPLLGTWKECIQRQAPVLCGLEIICQCHVRSDRLFPFFLPSSPVIQSACGFWLVKKRVSCKTCFFPNNNRYRTDGGIVCLSAENVCTVIVFARTSLLSLGFGLLKNALGNAFSERHGFYQYQSKYKFCILQACKQARKEVRTGANRDIFAISPILPATDEGARKNERHTS